MWSVGERGSNDVGNFLVLVGGVCMALSDNSENCLEEEWPMTVKKQMKSLSSFEIQLPSIIAQLFVLHRNDLYR